MTSKPDRALVLEFSSALQFLKPDEEAFTLWLNTMAGGDYAFGYGLLRSYEDEYDPCGILVAINGGDWRWDAQDESWAYADSATTLNPMTVAKWLGMARDWHWLNIFLDSLTRLSDQSTAFAPIVAVLREALSTMQTTRERFHDGVHLAHTSGRMLGPNSDLRSENLMRRDLKPFYVR
ncbi:hypothetical protein KABACHOK_03120 [Brevundimonas phage vB_BpoS-Kabachok]|uniref:Uncharacterized protein n=1 Tax=Brevundimonas phage vB_BpoS-Kabachok TaxID=2948600 RepID=A0A9E7MPC2_9CAUD|nr:hypothetical protein KABACHOK_03120 [Brevundimonas phage vB_BpoS-Kabachok]